MTARNGSPWDRVAMALAAVLGLGIGWLDIHTTELTVAITALLVAGVICGGLQPRAPWRWAIAIALGVPIVEAVAQMARAATPEPIRLDPRVWLVVAALAAAGCYLGAFVGRMLRGTTHAALEP